MKQKIKPSRSKSQYGPHAKNYGDSAAEVDVWSPQQIDNTIKM